MSGVGKTTAAKAVLDRYPTILHFQASDLLKRVLGQTGEALRTADSSRIEENQSALATALTAARATFPGRPAIVDAHSVIDNDKGLVDLPLTAFSALQPAGIVFLRAAPEVVAERRSNDVRARPTRTVNQLKQYQDRAEAVAREHARKLQVPFETIESSETDALLRFIASRFGYPAGEID